MSKDNENKFKLFALLQDSDIKDLINESKQLNLDIEQIIIDCNYHKSCVIKKVKQIIAAKNLRNMINEEQKNKDLKLE